MVRANVLTAGTRVYVVGGKYKILLKDHVGEVEGHVPNSGALKVVFRWEGGAEDHYLLSPRSVTPVVASKAKPAAGSVAKAKNGGELISAS